MNTIQYVLLGLMATSTTGTFAQASFQTVGYLAGGNPVSHALGTSHNGSTVVGYSTVSFAGIVGFQWSSGPGMTQIPILPDTNDYLPYATSPSGRFITGTHGSGGGPIGFVWSNQLGTVAIGDLPGGKRDSYLSDITDDGYGVGASSFAFSSTGAGLFRAIQWDNVNGLTELPLPSANDDQFNSSARAVLSDGRIFGKSASGAWLYSPDTASFEMLDGAGAMSRVSADGEFFAGETTIGGGARAAYWTRDGGLTPLPLLDGHSFSNLRGMSDDGSVIVGESVHLNGIGNDRVIWIDQMAPIPLTDFATSLGIDMTGWRITAVSGVSGDGSTIVGTARHESWESGHLEGFVLTIPAPASAGVLGVVLVAFRRRR